MPWARARGIAVVADACHSLGGSQDGRPVGMLADASCFSFHPVKIVTTGEGGMITTDRDDVAALARQFRNHGISTDHRQRESLGTWAYDMVALGHNLRLPDTACALGTSQLRKLGAYSARRREIAARYAAAFADEHSIVRPLAIRSDVTHGFHLYVVRLRLDRLTVDRARVFAALRAEGIGVNVHYRPVYLHTYYQKTFGLRPGLCPTAERAYEELLSLPLFPGMTDDDVEDVIAAITKVADEYACR
jgi:perosamine synthetase